jgi:hypothetical protein
MRGSVASSQRPSWVTVTVLGPLLHAELLYLFASGVMSRTSPADGLTVMGIGIVATTVAGWAGHVRQRRDWVVAGLIVIGLTYLVLAGLVLLALRIFAGMQFGDS